MDNPHVKGLDSIAGWKNLYMHSHNLWVYSSKRSKAYFIAYRQRYTDKEWRFSIQLKNNGQKSPRRHFCKDFASLQEAYTFLENDGFKYKRKHPVVNDVGALSTKISSVKFIQNTEFGNAEISRAEFLRLSGFSGVRTQHTDTETTIYFLRKNEDPVGFVVLPVATCPRRSSEFVSQAQERLSKAETELQKFFSESPTEQEKDYKAALALCWVQLALADLEGYSK